ncbi:hypothetical protein SAMN06265220_102939 [Flavobacterium nitrogenifigens]|uniref:Uncharacterized protein n=1 Tax=Flavobacterium nitrogenifigens TaxID=1617283 RepID=A0A521D252_9FLAO|nr:hypothetical protein SAMN06265220_102939 [Flavobacterium nitrogenifigens]
MKFQITNWNLKFLELEFKTSLEFGIYLNSNLRLEF